MITEMSDLPQGVLGFEAKGEVTGDDYTEVLVPAVEAALEANPKISILYVLGDEFDEYTAKAAWDDTKVGMEHMFSFERIALVTDHPAYQKAVRGFGFLLPAKVKVFSNHQVGAAKEWISAG